ncbi:MAG: PAS domain S-box protein [Thaumarchaeota archaeon]|nr:PAS domain S-box protein [Nitrososphaerota archaeon]
MKLGNVVKTKFLWVSFGFASLAWIFDTIFDSRVLEEGTVVQQLIGPSFDEILVRTLFTAIIVSFGVYVQLNVTRRKKADESLWLFSEAADAAYNGIQITDLSGRILYSNKAVEGMYGFSPDEYKGMNVAEMNADPEFASKVVFPSLQKNGRWRGEIEVKHKDGHTFPIWLTAAMIKDAKGEPSAMVGIISDITERKQMEENLRKARDELESRVKERTAELTKTNEALRAEISERKRIEDSLIQSEEKYHSLVDNIQDGVFIIQDGKLQFVNEAFARMAGYKVEEVIGKDFRQFVAPEDVRMVADRYQRRQSGENIPSEYEFRLLHKDGKTRVLINMTVGLVSYHGRVASIGTVKNITEKKKLEAQLLRAQRMESVGTLAEGVAHDINNVLSPIMLSLYLLKEKFKDSESQELLSILESGARRGSELIKQVQSFAIGMEGKRVALQAAYLISELRQIAKETFPRNIEIKTNISDNLWTTLGDATQLHQVLMNLCVNARDAMPDGGTLEISAENIDIDEAGACQNINAKTGPYIAIKVSDTGTGIPPEIMNRMFEPFFTTKEPGKGTGLGLSTALAIVKSHGGFIDVYSEVGKGTVFNIYLPATNATETQKVNEQVETPKGQGELILVVDDETTVSKITCSVLESHGYKVITAFDGANAIPLYKQHKEQIKAVIMDMMLPIMDGQKCITAIREINPEVKVIAVSGLVEKNRLTDGATHAQAFLPKPYTSDILLKTVYEVLHEK